jgi:hypothetical protein
MPIGSSYLELQVNVTGTATNNATKILEFEIPSAGTWDIEYFTYGTSSTGGIAQTTPVSMALYQDDALVPMSEKRSIVGTTVYGRHFLTTTRPVTVAVKVWTDNGRAFSINPSQGRTGVLWTLDQNGSHGPTGATGAIGPVGATGATGAIGPVGATGPHGTAATITVGTVTTGAPGSAGVVANVGTSSAARLNFSIPQGPKGDRGPIGATGVKGDTGAMGATGAAGANGATGPQGAKGDTGTAGSKGDKGDRGSVNITVQNRAPYNNEGVVGDIWYQI